MAESSDQEDSSYMIWVEEGGGPGSKLGLGLGLGKKRRFSEEQVKSLELMFETQAKLDPRKKLQLAKDLGLHPRQVAIWFQNKRARWKSKQLEREYAALKADYDALLSSFDSLKTEKQALAKQLHKLAEVFDKQVLQDQRSGKEDEKSVPWIEKSDIDEENNREKEDQLGRLYAEPAVAGDETLQAVPMTEQHFLFPPSCWPTPASSQWWDFWPMNG